MGKVKLSSAQPEIKLNGLAAGSPYLVAHPHDVVFALVKVKVDEIRDKVVHVDDEDADDDGMIRVPVVQLVAAELLTDPHLVKDAAELYRRAYFQRTGDGANTLPSELVQMPEGYRDARENGNTPAPTSGIPSPAFAGPAAVNDPT